MPCTKCNYIDKKNIKKFNQELCLVCSSFAPTEMKKFQEYIAEKIDWKMLDTFRKFNSHRGQKQKIGMSGKAQSGFTVTRPPTGYSIKDKQLSPNQDAIKIFNIFSDYLYKNQSLSNLSRKYNLSVNGIKKILKNRTYLGEIKFNKQLHKGNHKSIISQEIFYAAQRKLSK